MDVDVEHKLELLIRTPLPIVRGDVWSKTNKVSSNPYERRIKYGR